MTSKPRAKTFDCVEYKREIQLRIYDDIRNLTPEEEIEYFRRKADEGPLGQWWKAVKKSNQSRSDNASP